MAEADAAAGTQPAQPSSPVIPVTTTMRQKLKDADLGKNVWPQQFPKLLGAERRDKAHLKAAGLVPNKRKTKKEKTVTTPSSNDNNSNKDDDTLLYQHLGRALGGPDAVMRHRAVLQLEHYLQARCETTGLSELDLLKLSKCLWYTLYMADRQVVQAELSKIISRLVVEILAGTEEEDQYAAALYLRACEADDGSMVLENDMDMKDDGGGHGGGGDDDDDDDDDDEENGTAFPIEEPDSEDENVDYMAKQMELLEDDDNEEEAGDDDAEEEENKGENESDEVAVRPMEDAEDDDDEDDDVELEEQETDEEGSSNPTDDPVHAPHGRGAHLSALFFRTFLRTILQQWAVMDKYRIDKFYTMLRYILDRMYSYCALRGWNSGMIRLFNDGLCDEVLAKLPNGIRCHLIDVCLDELVQHQEDVTEAVFLDVVQPFFSMAQTGVTGDDLVHTRAVENVLDRFLDKYSVFADGPSDSPRFHQVHVGTVAQFIFAMASDEMTLQRYRPRLYEVYKKYMKCIRLNGEENDVDITRVDLSLDNEDEDEEEAKEKAEDNANDEEAHEENDPASNPVVEVVEELKPKSNTTEKSTLIEKNEVTESHTDDKGSKKKRKKKKKRSKETSQLVSFDGRPQQETVISDEWKTMIESQIKGKVTKLNTENEIVISMKEQRNAKAMMKKGQTDGAARKRGREEPSETMGESEKRVKFGDKNRAKSHKASMQALRQASPPSGIRPDRGILKNKDAKIALKKKKGRRRS